MEDRPAGPGEVVVGVARAGRPGGSAVSPLVDPVAVVGRLRADTVVWIAGVDAWAVDGLVEQEAAGVGGVSEGGEEVEVVVVPVGTSEGVVGAVGVDEAGGLGQAVGIVSGGLPAGEVEAG